MKLGRRSLLRSSAAGLAACGVGTRSHEPELRLIGQSPGRGHRLRTGGWTVDPITSPARARVIIVGGGVAGTSAAWRLHAAGVEDVVIMELESEPGGTARAGRHAASPYPMGAHYLPAPGPDLPELVDLLDALGLVVGRDEAGAPLWLPSAICAAPTERHQLEGRWEPGLYPSLGESQSEADQWARWIDHLRQLDAERDADGRRSFALPVARSSERRRGLDGMSMSAYLDELGIDSWRARWTIEYACLDDYGCSLRNTSAFAGLHHFLARGIEDERDAFLLSFPNGNAELLRRMRARLGEGARWMHDTAAVDIDPTSGGLLAHDFTNERTTSWHADAIVWAAPRFVLPFVCAQDSLPRDAIGYAPWLVANVALDRPPAGPGAPLAWDNVPVGADHLGYVVATHGAPGASAREDASSVITFYQPFDATEARPDVDLARLRAELFAGDATHWGRHVIARLEAMHPGIAEDIRSVHVHRWGHGMVRPEPGLLFGDTLARARAPLGDRVFPCATDTRGLALFEEAFYAGIEAADAALVRLS